ncbi:MAG: ABC transporter ATP-binding protein [Chloroflexi bacterium]|nr:ABC transporter ATP-binding protein [Chloroflexota bacterium]
MLVVREVDAAYGLVQVLWQVGLEVHRGEIVALIGSNGAGKSTTLRIISGLMKPMAGEVRFNGARIDGQPPDSILRRGIAHVPEGRRLFGNLTVRENLVLGGYARRREAIPEALERVYELFPILKTRTRQLAGTMSGGEQQMLAIGRALMSDPTLLLLDEPSLGIMPKLVTRLFESIAEIRKFTTILLVEQNVHLALEIADRGYVLENGRTTLVGASQDLMRNDVVINAYLGHDLVVGE